MIEIADYFNKYGFNDGDSPKLLKKVRILRPVVAMWLNEWFKKEGLPYIAVEVDYETCHNPVRMELQWREDGKLYTWDLYYGLRREAAPGSISTMERVEEDGCPPGVLEILTAATLALNKGG